MTVYNVNSTGNPAADGTTLLGVLAGTVSGDVVNVGAGTFDVGANQTVVPAGVTLSGAGIDVTVIASAYFSATHAAVPLASGATFQGFTLNDTTSAYPFGGGSLDAAFTGAVVRSVKVVGQGKCFRLAPANCSATFTSCVFVCTDVGAGADCVNVLALNAVLTFANCTLTATGTTNAARGLVFVLSGASLITVTGGSITLTGSATPSARGVFVQAGTALLSGVTIATVNPGGTPYDVAQSGTGKVTLFNCTFNAAQTTGNYASVTWPTPTPITAGTPLGVTQLNAAANVASTFAYTPAAGALLSPGTQTLSTTFTPTNLATYAAITGTVSLTVTLAPLHFGGPGPRLDFSRDYLVWDNTVPVRVQSRRAAGGPVVAVPVAKRRGILAKELAASNGVYVGDDVVFLVPAALLPPGWVLKPADVVLDCEARYTVLGADWLKHRQTWRLTTRDLVLAHDLRDAVDVERAAISYDGAGGAVKAFPSGPGPRGGSYLVRALPARVQLLTEETRDERGIRGFTGTHAVIVAEQLDLIDEDRLAWTVAGVTTYLDIVGYHNPQRIDELPVIDAELRP